MQRVPGDRWQGFRTVAGMVAVITAVLAGSTAAVAAILIFEDSLAAAVISGTLVALPTMIALIRYRIRPGNAPPLNRSGPARTDQRGDESGEPSTAARRRGDLSARAPGHAAADVTGGFVAYGVLILTSIDTSDTAAWALVPTG